MNPLAAVREACETRVCPGEPCNWNKKCMKKCFTEKKDAIMSCCTEQCDKWASGLGYTECIEACNMELLYPDYDGPVQLGLRNVGGSLYQILRITFIVLLILYFIGMITLTK